MAEVALKTTKDKRLPSIKQLSEHRGTTQTKFQSLIRQENSKCHISTANIRTFRPKETVFKDQTNKTLLKSISTINSFNLRSKAQTMEVASDNKNTQKQTKKSKLTGLTMKYLTDKEQSMMPLKFKQNQQMSKSNKVIEQTTNQHENESDGLLMTTLNCFYHNNLAQGVTLKVIDIKQEE